MNIESMLKTYRVNKAKVRCGELEIEGLEEYLKNKHKIAGEDVGEIIEGLSISSKPLSDMPRCVTNKHHSIVEDVCISFWNNWKQSRPDKEEILQRIVDIESRLYPLKQEIKLIDNVLIPCLDIKESFIIQCLYIDGYSWAEIVPMYADRFEIREERTLKDIRKFAIRKMEGVILKIA